MYVAHLSLHDFRSYRAVEVEISAGVTAIASTRLVLPCPLRPTTPSPLR